MTPTDRGHEHAQIFDNLLPHWPLMQATPNIVGPIYGARMCDRAQRPYIALYRLLIGLSDALPAEIRAKPSPDWAEWHNRLLHPVAARNDLRARSGESPLVYDVMRQTMRGWSMPVLTLAEHRTLGTDLKALHAAVVAAECNIGNAGGPPVKDLTMRARKVRRPLLTLRSHLDSVVFREFSNSTTATLTSAYFGADALAAP
jgi:hypothetical protein